MSDFRVKRRKIIIESNNDKTNININIIFNLLKKQEVQMNELKKEIFELKSLICEQNKILNNKNQIYEKEMCEEMRKAYM